MKKNMSIELDRTTKALLRAGLEKEKCFLFALSDPSEFKASSDTVSKEEALISLFIDICRIED